MRYPLLVIALLILSRTGAQSPVLRSADSLKDLGQFSKALELYQKFSNTELRQAQCYEALGLNGEAKKMYNLALQSNPENTLLKYRYTKSLLRSGHLTEADSILKTLILSNPDNPNFYYQRGLVKEQRGDSTSMDFYEATLSLENRHQDARYKLARYKLEKRQFEQALPYIEDGLGLEPNSLRFLTLKGLHAYYTEDYHSCNTTYEILTARNESNPQLHEIYGISLHNTLQYEKAVEQFTVLINSYDDQNPRWHYLIGKSFMAMRENDKARRHLEISLALHQPPLTEELFTLSLLYQRMGEYPLQIETLQLAQSKNPDHQRVTYFLATAIDNYYKDKEAVIPYYEAYLKKFGDQGMFSEYAKQRIKDLKEELHFTKD